MRKVPKLSIALLCAILFLTIFSSYVTSHSPYQLDRDSILLPPSFEHIFGTDRLGRDLFARVLEGAKVSIVVGVLSSLVATFIGLIIGVTAGFLKGRVDRAFMVIIDLFLTFPTFFLLLALVSYIEASALVLIFVISVTGWMSTARIIRSESFAISNKPYIKILKIAKVSRVKIVLKYFTPTLSPIFLVSFTFGVGGAILAESSLSFLGLGITPPQMSLGLILSEGKSVIDIAPWISFFSGLFIFLLTLSLVNISDYLQSLFNQKSI